MGNVCVFVFLEKKILFTVKNGEHIGFDSFWKNEHYQKTNTKKIDHNEYLRYDIIAADLPLCN